MRRQLLKLEQITMDKDLMKRERTAYIVQELANLNT